MKLTYAHLLNDMRHGYSIMKEQGGRKTVRCADTYLQVPRTR